LAKDLKSDIVDLGSAKMLSGTVDPTAGAGVPAPEGSIYLMNAAGAGQLFIKTGAGDTAWTASGGGGGGWETLEESYSEPGTPFPNFDFAAVLNGNVDKMYRIVGWISLPQVTDFRADCLLRVNGVNFTGGDSDIQYTLGSVITHYSKGGLVIAKQGYNAITTMWVDALIFARQESGPSSVPFRGFQSKFSYINSVEKADGSARGSFNTSSTDNITSLGIWHRGDSGSISGSSVGRRLALQKYIGP
jgi:hypothetical protein